MITLTAKNGIFSASAMRRRQKMSSNINVSGKVTAADFERADATKQANVHQ